MYMLVSLSDYSCHEFTDSGSMNTDKESAVWLSIIELWSCINHVAITMFKERGCKSAFSLSCVSKMCLINL